MPARALPAEPELATTGEAARAERGRSHLVRNLLYLAGGQVATWTLTAIWTIAVPRSLGPVGMGQLTIAWSATAIVNILCEFGTGVLIVRNVARDGRLAGRLAGTGIAVRVATIPVGWALVAAYIMVAHFDSVQVMVLVLATLGMQVGLVNAVVLAAFQGIERMQYLAYADVVNKSLMTVGSIWLVITGHGVVAVVALSLGLTVLSLGLGLFWSRRHFRIDFRTSLREVRALVRGGLPFWASGLFLTAYIWIDSVMLSFMTSPSVVGWYGAPTKLFATLLFVPALIATAAFPRLVAAHEHGRGRFDAALVPLVEWTAVLCLPLAIGTIVVAGPVVELLYGPRFGPSVVVLQLLAASLPFTYMNIIGSQALAASERQMVWAKVMAAAAIVNPLINLAMIPFAQTHWHNGAAGAAASLLATEILMAAAALYIARSALRVVHHTRVLRALVAAAAMGVLTWYFRDIGLGGQVAAGIVIFGGLALLTRVITRAELLEARALLRPSGVAAEPVP